MGNILRLTWRNVTKRKFLSGINILGLSLGLAAAALMLLYSRYEWNYDRFHADADRIQLVQKYRFTALGLKILDDTWIPLLPALQGEYPAVESGVRVYSTERWVEYGGNKQREEITYADASLLDVFTFPLIRGNSRNALNDLSSVIISSEMAFKYFGAADPIGKRLRINFNKEFTVTGVLDKIPANSSIRPGFVVPFGDLINLSDPREANNWGGSFLWTFLKLKKGESPRAFEEALRGFVKKQFGDDGPNGSKQMQLRLLGLTEYRNAETGNRIYIYALCGMAITILLIAGFNYTNLSTSRFIERIREMGVRKACGALRAHIIRQLLGEAMTIAGSAAIMAIVLADLLLPVLNRWYASEILMTTTDIVFILGVGVLLGCAAVLYPAWALSRARVIESLRGKWGQRLGRVRVQDLLIVMQFSIAVLLIVGTLGVQKQLKYMQSQKLNFDQDQLISIPVSVRDFADREAAGQHLAVFRQKLSQRPEIVSVAASRDVPGRVIDANVFATPEGWTAPDPLRLRVTYVDDKLLSTLGVPLVAGRDFDRSRSTESDQSIILNESAARAMGWTHGAVGKKVRVGDRNWTVVGVAKDYHTESLKTEVRGEILFYRDSESSAHLYLTARVSPHQTAGAVEAITSLWSSVDPARPPEYFFLDDAFRKLYESEIRWGQVTLLASGLALFIAAIGLLGLISISVVQRTKEIGIRKVLGASSGQVMAVLSKRFALLVLLSNIMAWPLAYLSLSRWLQEFAYRTHAGIELFVVGGGIAFGIALATVGLHAWRAASRNPVEALRYE